MPGLALTASDRRILSGEEGEAPRLAMRLVVAMAEMQGAARLLDIGSAHIDGCLYHGQASVDFAERLAHAEARVIVPTTLNVSSLDLLHPTRYRGDPDTGRRARHLMDLYVAMGCRPTWTCAPYQLPVRPAFGEHVAWAESNAIVFCNSVLGARTDRYGDFIDICAAVTGRVGDAGLHRPEHRVGRMVFRLTSVPARLLGHDVLYPVLGHLVGREAGVQVPVLEGLLPTATEDQLKALGAAAASSGSVAMFHAVGITPEAPSLRAALGGRPPLRSIDVGMKDLRRARDDLSTTSGGAIRAVSVGTPHASLAELTRLASLLDGATVDPRVELFVSTGRDVLGEAAGRGLVDRIEGAGAKLVVDTCTYITPILPPGEGAVMTDSGKWAFYAPGNLGVDVVFGSLEECVRTAIEGELRRDPELWADA